MNTNFAPSPDGPAWPPSLTPGEANEAIMRHAVIDKMCQAAITLNQERIAAMVRQAGGFGARGC